jgi:hypothetical protein
MRPRCSNHWLVVAHLAIAVSLWAPLFAAFTACGGKTAEEGAPPDHTVTCNQQVGTKPVQHACSHTTNGPFENVVAGDPATAPDVDSIHVSYLVETANSEQPFVRFTPSRTGEHLLLLDSTSPLHITDEADGKRLTPLFADVVEGCQTAHYGEVYSLERNQGYRIQLPTAESPTLLFFEHLATFGNGAWQEGCLEEE